MRKDIAKPFLKVFAAALAVLAAAGLAEAGPNAGGVLVAQNSGLLFSTTDSTSPICAQGAVPSDLSQVNPRIDGAHDPLDPAIFTVFAAFPEGSSPRLRGITFGVSYDSTRVFLSQPYGGPCGDFEVHDPNWPSPDTGTSVTWLEGHTQTSRMTAVYWFAAYQYNTGGGIQPAQFALIPNPGQGGYFGDDQTPGQLDPIGGYGRIGFDMDGYVPPYLGSPGACCDLTTDVCSVRLASDCGDGFEFKGPNVPCDPDPCEVIGGCCHPDNRCESNVNRQDCAAAGGHFLSEGCASETCSFYPQGACCRDGGTTCTVTIAADCLDGLWRERFDCSGEPQACFTTMGACCVGTDCVVVPFEEDCPGIFLLLEDCEPQGGVCSPPLGACCMSTDECVITTQEECSAQALYWKAGRSCTESAICLTPVVPMSWGKLKSLYK